MGRRAGEGLERRLALVRWTAGLGAVTAESLALMSGATVARERARLGAAARAGLVAGARPLTGGPTLYVATTLGVRSCGSMAAPAPLPSPAGAAHAAACASAAAALRRCFPAHEVVGEAELLALSRRGGPTPALAALPGGGRSQAARHRPDLLLRAPRQAPVAVEVELTVKAHPRLVAICRGWARSRAVAGVLYLTGGDRVGAALAAAIATARAGERVVALPLAELLEGCTRCPPSPWTVPSAS